VLEADARYAQSTGDAARAAADFHAMLGITRHQEAPFVITRLVGIGIYSLTFDRLEKSLAANPSIFTDQELIDLAHRISMVGGDTASSLLDLESERMSFRDIMQRMFTDDGHGDGRLTPEGARSMSAFLGTVASNSKRNDSDSVANKVHLMSLSGAASAIASRKENIDEYDRLLSEQERRNARPLRECSDSERTDLVAEKRVSEINASSILYARLWPVSLMTPSLNRAAVTAERLLAQREGLLIGIAMELYQRRHNGQYPPTLDALVPSMLPKVPEDRIVGGPVHYKLVDGKPVIYSVGVDRDDDGGTAATDAAGQSAATAAAEWTQPAGRKQGPIDGDWILYDGRPKPSLPTTRPS
jgi:hypothetical protein